MWIQKGHGGTRNLSQSGSNKQGEDQKLRRIFRPKSQIQTVFRPKTGDLQTGASPALRDRRGGGKFKIRGAKLFHHFWIGLRRSFSENQVIFKKKGLRRNREAFSGRNHKFKRFFRPKPATFFFPKNTVGGLEINRGGGGGGQKRKSGSIAPAGDAPVSKTKKNILTGIESDFPAEIRNSNVFSGRKRVISKKKRSSSQKCHEIRCQSTKITKIPLANTNSGLNLHSSSPEPVNFFGAQSWLGGARHQNAPPWRRTWNIILR